MDPSAVDNFKEHVVVVSMMVMEELDGLKRRSSTEYEARQAINRILYLTTRHRPGEPIRLRSGGTFILDAAELGSSDIRGYDLTLDKPDNRLLALAMRFKKDPAYPDRVVIVTNDAAVRIKAHSLGLASEEYEAVNYRSRLDELYRDPTTFELSDEEAMRWHGGKPVLVRVNGGHVHTGYFRNGAVHQYGSLAGTLVQPLNHQQELALQVLYDQQVSLSS
ncbi:MAG: hypothetical protein F4Z31_19915 [Gemmatimonadetes bacterium]|nr:hypothetical protein [Gemmatimonadota bacterium]